MYISNITIRNYRSILSVKKLKFDRLAMLCGPNSSGKSNILRAISLAFEEFPQDKFKIAEFVRGNLSSSKANSSARIYIEVTLCSPPRALHEIAESTGNELSYRFTATKSGSIIRRLGNKELSAEEFQTICEHFSVIYIPTIRDSDREGLKPFFELFKKTVVNSNGERELTQHLKSVKKTLSKRSTSLLGSHRHVARGMLNVDDIELDTDGLAFDYLYENLSLKVKHNKARTPLNGIGTGHQSAVILNLYKQIGEESQGKTLYLFEEPDSHLHPPTIRLIGDLLTETARSSQVILSTHSPILINQLGIESAIHLINTEKEGTLPSPKSNQVDNSTVNHILLKYGIKITEALFSNLVVLVEGPSDAIVVGRLLERRTSKNADQLDLLIIPANGKENIIELATILTKLGIKWVALFDHDAALTTSSVPITISHYGKECEEYISMLDELALILNTTKKRGKNAAKQLTLISEELNNGRPSEEYMNNSSLERLLKGVCSLPDSEIDSITSFLENGQVTNLRKGLEKHQIWLLKPDLEGALLGPNNKNAVIIDPILRNKNLITVPATSSTYINSVRNALHKLANAPSILVEIIDAIDSNGGFNRSDLNYAVKYAASQVGC